MGDFKYEVNGQVVEFDREPTEADIDEAAAQLGASPQQPAQAPQQAVQQRPGLIEKLTGTQPGKRFTPGEVEEKIAGRQDLLSAGIKTVARDVTKSATSKSLLTRLLPPSPAGPLLIGLGVLERGYSAFANVGIEAEKQAQSNEAFRKGLIAQGVPEEKANELASKEEIKKLLPGLVKAGKAGLKGITGERRGQIGDIFRLQGFTDRQSATAGLIADTIMMAGVTSAVKTVTGKTVGRAAAKQAVTKAKIAQAIDEPFAKSVGVAKKGRLAGAVAKGKQSTREAVETIVDNKQSLKFVDEVTGEVTEGILPRTIAETSQSVRQLKTKFYNQWDEIIQQSGNKVQTKNVVELLEKTKKGFGDKLFNQPLIAYADEQIKLFQTVGKEMTVAQADDALKSLNKGINQFFTARIKDPAKSATINLDMAMRDVLNAGVDDALKGIKSTTFRQARKQYSSLRTVEELIERAAQKELTRGPGLVGRSVDVVSTSQALVGIVTNRLDKVLSAVTLKGASAVNTFLNQPSRIMRIMFQSVDKIKTKAAADTVRSVAQNLKSITLRGAAKTGLRTTVRKSVQEN